MHALAGWYGDHTVDATSEGVTVRKGLDLDTLALPAMKFEIRSTRDHPVGVRVVDRLPSTMDPSRIGLHADFAADQWTAFEDGRITFTTRLDPERPVVTLYGVWLDDPSRIHELFDVPDVKVVSDPDAPSLAPVGDEVKLPTVDNSLRSVGPDALEDLRNDVETALTEVRASPADSPTALPGDDGANTATTDEPAGTMGDHAWAYPVERQGTGRIAAPTHADLDDLVDESVGDEHIYVRAALTETHHGGGGAVLLQELANAFEIVARQVTGDSERATVDAVIKTPLGTDAVLTALADRDQVTDALVSPLVGDREDTTGIDATPESDTATTDRDDTTEVSVEPDAEDVEIVLNAEGERFSELQEEFEQETDTDVLEEELQTLQLPGLDLADEPTIDELVDDANTFDVDDSGFVPANVKSTRDEDYELDLSSDDDEADCGDRDESVDESTASATGLNFGPDAESTDDRNGKGDAESTDVRDEKGDAEADEADAFSFGDEILPESEAETEPEGAADADVDAEPDVQADAPDGQEDADAVATGHSEVEPAPDADGAVDAEPDTSQAADSSPAAVADATSDATDAREATDGPSNAPADTDATAAGTLGEDATSGEEMVTLPASELEAIRAELRELRDRVASLETELEAATNHDEEADEQSTRKTNGTTPATDDAASKTNGEATAKTDGGAGVRSDGEQSSVPVGFENDDYSVMPGDVALEMFETPEPIEEDAE